MVKETNTKGKTSQVKRGRRVTLLKKGVKEEFDEGKHNFFYENLEEITKEIDAEKLLRGSVVAFSNCYQCTFKKNSQKSK